MKLDALEAAHRRATKGRYFINRYDNSDGSITWQVQSENESSDVIANFVDRDAPRAKQDAEFHVAAHRDLPALIQQARKGGKLAAAVIKFFESFEPADEWTRDQMIALRALAREVAP